MATNQKQMIHYCLDNSNHANPLSDAGCATMIANNLLDSTSIDYICKRERNVYGLQKLETKEEGRVFLCRLWREGDIFLWFISFKWPGKKTTRPFLQSTHKNHYSRPTSRRLFWMIMSLTAAMTNLICLVSVAQVKWV